MLPQQHIRIKVDKSKVDFIFFRFFIKFYGTKVDIDDNSHNPTFVVYFFCSKKMAKILLNTVRGFSSSIRICNPNVWNIRIYNPQNVNYLFIAKLQFYFEFYQTGLQILRDGYVR
jgi:hypothetical protein